MVRRNNIQPHREVPVEELNPGLVLSRGVFDENGNLLLAKGTELGEHHIEKLLQMRIRTVPVDTDDKAPESQADSSGQGEESFIRDLTHSLRPLSTNTENIAAEELDKLWTEAKISSSISKKVIDKVVTLSRSVSNELRMKKMASPMIYEPVASLPTHILHMLNAAVVGAGLFATSGTFQNEAIELALVFLLYDIGKARIPVRILERSEPLEESQLIAIKRHPINSYEVAVSFKNLSEQDEQAILFHHENLDGSGYPNGLKADVIPSRAKLLRILDSYVAMCSPRPYRVRVPHRQALSNILVEHGKTYEQTLVKLFIESIGFYPEGTIVRLSDFSLAVVTGKAPREAPFSPTVKILYNGEPLDEPREVALSDSDSNPAGLYVTEEIF